MMVFRYYSFSQWPHAGQIWGCLRGVWMVSRVSGSVWLVSENVIQMSGVCRCIVNWNQSNKYHDYQILLFLPVVACRGVSDGCLDGVWGCMAVSGWCLSVSGRCLGWVDGICRAKNTRKQHGWVKMTPKNTKKGQKTQKQFFSPKQPNKIGSNLECGLSHIPTS